MFHPPQYADSLWFHWTNSDEELRKLSSDASGNSGTIFARCASSDVIPGICKGFDGRLARCDNPTRSQTEAALAQMFSDMLGNIQAYIRNIAMAVTFSLSLVAGKVMAMSMRERTTKVAVLKAIGFSKLRILSFVLGESTMISLLGGMLGIAGGTIALHMSPTKACNERTASSEKRHTTWTARMNNHDRLPKSPNPTSKAYTS